MCRCCMYLLLEVASVLFINQHQVEVIAHRELFVDLPHRRRQIVAAEEQADGDGFSCRHHKMHTRVGSGGTRNTEPLYTPSTASFIPPCTSPYTWTTHSACPPLCRSYSVSSTVHDIDWLAEWRHVCGRQSS